MNSEDEGYFTRSPPIPPRMRKVFRRRSSSIDEKKKSPNPKGRTQRSKEGQPPAEGSKGRKRPTQRRTRVSTKPLGTPFRKEKTRQRTKHCQSNTKKHNSEKGREEAPVSRPSLDSKPKGTDRNISGRSKDSSGRNVSNRSTDSSSRSFTPILSFKQKIYRGFTEGEKMRRVSMTVNRVKRMSQSRRSLILEGMELSPALLPLKDLANSRLGNVLCKISLKGNPLQEVSPKLVSGLPALRTLILSYCGIHELPEDWHLPQLKRLDLSHNFINDFPDEKMLEGLPELEELDMYNNKVKVIIINPDRKDFLSKLKILNLGWNELVSIPDEVAQLSALRKLKLMSNGIKEVPLRVCKMDSITDIDLSSNPLDEQFMKAYNRGIQGMREHYHDLAFDNN